MNPLLDPAAVERTPLSARKLPTSTYALLERAAQKNGEGEALVLLDGPETVTYAELLGRVTRVANALSRLGVARGDAVALLSPNNGELLTSILAAEAVGIAQPINPVLGPEAIAAMLTMTRARVLIAAGPEISPQLWGLAVALGERFGLDSVLALRPDGSTGTPPGLGGGSVRVDYLADRTAGESADVLAAAPPAAGDIAAYFHTGGTTDTPKLAAHSHENEVYLAWAIAETTDDQQTSLFGGLPMFHVNAVIVTILAPMFLGGRVVWAGPTGYRDPSLYPQFWKLVERYRITSMSAVPTVYARLAQVPVDADVSSLRYVVTGATAMPSGVRDAFEANTKVPIVDGYGLTEATCASARIVPGHPRRGSVGLRMPYQQIRAVSPENGNPLPAGETGVITIHGPAVFPGYVTVSADGTVSLDPLGKVTDGWLDTGDLGHVDADGYLFVTGRLKDLIIRGGHNIDPVLVEESLLGHPAVIEVSAVGRPDVHAGEVPVCYVTLNAEVEEEELLAWATAHAAEPAVTPKAVHVLAELPLTAVGKVFKPALRGDAVQRVVEAELPGADVTVRIEGGTPVAEVRVPKGRVPAVRTALSRYSFPWRTTSP